MSYHPYPKRDPNKNYFRVPNEPYHLGLSAGAIAMYGYLLHIEDRKTFRRHASYKTIGKATTMSANTVVKYVRELEDSYLIRTGLIDAGAEIGKYCFILERFLKGSIFPSMLRCYT